MLWFLGLGMDTVSVEDVEASAVTADLGDATDVDFHLTS